MRSLNIIYTLVECRLFIHWMLLVCLLNVVVSLLECLSLFCWVSFVRSLKVTCAFVEYHLYINWISLVRSSTVFCMFVGSHSYVHKNATTHQCVSKRYMILNLNWRTVFIFRFTFLKRLLPERSIDGQTFKDRLTEAPMGKYGTVRLLSNRIHIEADAFVSCLSGIQTR